MFTRRTVINYEKLERCFYRLPETQPLLMRCIDCGDEVSWVTPQQAQVLTGLTLREIFRRVEASLIHFSETPMGQVYICLNSPGLTTGKEGNDR